MQLIGGSKMAQTAVITGANRGLGAEFTRQLLEQSDEGYIVATYRSDPGELVEIAERFPKRLCALKLDVTDKNCANQIQEALPDKAIDLLIHNAGIYPGRGRMASTEEWSKGFLVNCIAPIELTQSLAENLSLGIQKRVAFVSSKMGSIEDNSSGGSYAYRSTKAALNAAAKSLAIDLAPRQISVLILHPGWVKTDMGGPSALIDRKTSIEGMLTQIRNLALKESGSFVSYDGSPVTW